MEAKKLLSLGIISCICTFSAMPSDAATLNSLKIDGNKLILSASELNKVNLKGNDTEHVSIILPETVIDNIYSYNTGDLTKQIQSSIPSIKALKLVQYSLEPAEARIIINSNSNIKPEINRNEKDNKIVIVLKSTSKYSYVPSYTEKESSTSLIGNKYYSYYTSKELSSDLENAILAKTNGNLDVAEEDLKNIITSNPSDLWAKYYLSLLYIEKHRVERAKELNDEILRVAPGFFASFYALGIINDIEGNIDQAIEMYKKANNLFPEYQDSHYRLGLDYLKGKEYSLAEAEFKRTINIYPEHNGALQNLGLLYLKQSKLEEAKKYFKLALRTDALNNLGNLLIQLENAENAIKYFNFALTLEPENAILNYNLAKAYQMQNDNEKALKYYEKTLSINPDMYNAYYNIAIIYAQTGDNQKSIDSFHKYLDLNPDANDANQVNALISKLENLERNE